MPLALRPNASFESILDSDANEPAASRPTFLVRYLNGYDADTLADKLDAIKAGETNRDVVKAVYEALEYVLAGWRNMIDPQTSQPIPFEPGNVRKVLCFDEALELIGKVQQGQRPDSVDLGNSELASSSAGDASASPAASDDASTAQASKSPSTSTAQDVAGSIPPTQTPSASAATVVDGSP